MLWFFFFRFWKMGCVHIEFYSKVEAKMSFLTSVVISAGAFYSVASFQDALRLSDVNWGHQSTFCIGL